MGKPKLPINHGTISGYQTHVNRKEPACKWCLRARWDYEWNRRLRGKCAEGLGWPLEIPRVR